MTYCDYIISYIIFGDYMKKKILIIFTAIFIGCSISYYVFNNKVLTLDNVVSYSTVKGFQIGCYHSFDNATKIADRYNGIVINDNGMYRVYSAILYNPDCINKIMKYYDSLGVIYYLRDIKVNSNFINSISMDEDLIINSELSNYNAILYDILTRYEEYL